MRSMRLKDKVAIVTGSARGIGFRTAQRFAEEGATVVICDLNDEAVTQAVEEIKSQGGKAIGMPVNVTKRDEVDTVITQVVNQCGKLDCLVNNAGITADNTLVKLGEDEWDRVIDVNLKGVYNVAQSAAKAMIENGGGVILNTSSVVGIYGNFGQTNYAAAKWGVIGMTKTWAKELGKKGIRVNAVAPGFIMTPMTEKMPEKVLDMMRGKSPLRTLGQPDDIANAFLYLASDEARFVTGTVLSVDGGVVL